MEKLLQVFLNTLLLVFLIQTGYSQSTTVGPGAFGHTGASVATDWCGWQNNAIPFNLEQRGTNRINFLTGGIQRMTILGTSSGATQGFVGIGNSFTAPLQRLHVVGDINLETSILTRTAINDGYRINNITVLQIKQADNLFIGWHAGEQGTNSICFC